jgi:hypothetical protein
VRGLPAEGLLGASRLAPYMDAPSLPSASLGFGSQE